MGNSQKLSNTNKKSSEKNPTSNLPIQKGNALPTMSLDNYSRIKQVLNSLYKNNFVSLSFEDLAAFYIQMTWKQHIIEKVKREKRGMIDFLYTTLEINPNLKSRTDRMHVLLDSLRYPYRCYDLVKYKNFKSIVETNGGYENLPAVFINNYYIGSEHNFQELHDLNLVFSILNKEYLKRCLVCNIIKTDKELDTCPYCYRQYLFFAKSTAVINVHESRMQK